MRSEKTSMLLFYNVRTYFRIMKTELRLIWSVSSIPVAVALNFTTVGYLSSCEGLSQSQTKVI